MATFDYDKSAATAERLIKKFGRTLVLSRSTPGAGPAHDPGPSSWTLYNVNAVILPGKKGNVEGFENALVQGDTLIDERVRFILLSAKGLVIEPTALDRLTFDGYDWEVLGVTPLNPAGTAVIYKTGVKRI